MEKVRIQKMLSEAGVASRRDVEEMILQGRITVNGDLVTSLPCFCEPGDEIRVDGELVRKRAEEKVYVLLNKPRGVICTQRDEPGRSRPKAVDLVSGLDCRVYCVGRLDEGSTGLIVLTNDGELTQRLTHPSYEVERTYVARIDGVMTPEHVDKLRAGLFVAGRRRAGAKVQLIRGGHDESLLQVKVAEGRNCQVRRMLLQLGYKVKRLHRSSIGPLDDRGLKVGRFRLLNKAEISLLRRSAGLDGGVAHGPHARGPASVLPTRGRPARGKASAAEAPGNKWRPGRPRRPPRRKG